MSDVISYLLASDVPWVRYRTMIDLLSANPNDPEPSAARATMLNHPQVKALIEELKDWPGIVLNSHKSAGQCYHRLAFLAEIGVSATDGAMAGIIAK
ncbi:MAG: hypothetical protein V1761_05940, partial [bacterium]